MLSLRAVVCFAVFAVATATNVDQCPGKNIDDLTNLVQLSPCKKAPCNLKRNSNQHITIKFKPAADMDDVYNHVQAKVASLDLPFIGVDGASICDKIFTENDEKANCPLKAGTTYVYKDSFPILAIYPTINTRIHWALVHNKNDIMCFEVNARIR